MALNKYENTLIQNKKLPEQWREKNSLIDFEDFLQQNWEKRHIFYTDNDDSSKQKFLNFGGQGSIKTTNYIGTISYKGEQLNIFPKMFRVDKDDQDTDDLSMKHLMFNLTKWLEYCNKSLYPFISIRSELDAAEDLKDFFITLYIGYVTAAIERGAYYQYVEETSDCTSIKGKFDVRDYFIDKIPNGNSHLFKCTYSKFEYDNKLNRIIKYTCRLLLNETTNKNQKKLRNILTKLDEVEIERCTPKDCDSIRLSSMHKDYKIILNMSKMFLLNKTSTYNLDTNESFCFLFPTEYLFEGFVGGFIQETLKGYGAKVKLQQSDMHLIDDVVYGDKSLGAAFTMRHDIVVTTKDNMFILDTKYKQVSRFEGNNDEIMSVVSNEPKQTDIYQMCEYARKQGKEDVFLLYPMYRYEEREPHFPIGISNGDEGTIRVHFIRLPFIFEESDEDKTAEMLKDIILTVLGIE